MSKQQQAFASLDPENFSTGSGLFDDVDAVVTGAHFTNEPPDGYTADGNPLFFVLELQIDGADGPVEQRYSMGGKAGDQFEVSEDGLGLIPAGPHSRLGASSKFGLFMAALKTEGFPIATLGGEDGNMGALVGLRAHFNRIPDPERKGLTQRPGQKEKKYPESTLVVTKIHTLPGEKPATAKKATTTAKPAAGKSTTKPTAAAARDDEDIKTAEETLVALLVVNDGTIQKSKLPILAARELGKHPRRQEVSKLIYSEAFLSRETAWTFDPSSNPQVVVAKPVDE